MNMETRILRKMMEERWRLQIRKNYLQP
jgi:hypothetical protein